MKRELIEQLADKEHASWARWMQYLFSKCYSLSNGDLAVPVVYVESLRKQIDTPYAELPEQEKQYDRDEVAHILSIIDEYAHSPLQEKVLKHHIEAIGHRLEGIKHTVRILEDQLNSLLREPDIQFCVHKMKELVEPESPLQGE